MREFMKVLGIFLKLKMQEIGFVLQIAWTIFLFILTIMISLWMIGFLSIAYIGPLSVLFQVTIRAEPLLGAPLLVGSGLFVISGCIALAGFLCYTVCTWIRSNWEQASRMSMQDE